MHGAKGHSRRGLCASHAPPPHLGATALRKSMTGCLSTGDVGWVSMAVMTRAMTAAALVWLMGGLLLWPPPVLMPTSTLV
jgi:hypothetical protein